MLADHIRTLLQDHDCVIIPDFGGLIADYAPARIHPVRHTLAPPAKRVAFNQSLTRNDGLLVDALSAKLNLSTSQARQMVLEAVQRMNQELEAGRRTDLNGVGTFRQAPGRGLEFEYTGSENLLGASFGLPELVSRPVRATDAMLARERPAPGPQLRGRTSRAAWTWRTLGIATIVGLVLSADYMFADMQGYLPNALRLPQLNVASASAPRQQASLSSAATTRTQSPAEVPAAVTETDWDTAAPAAAPTAALPETTTPAAAAPVALQPAAKTVVVPALKPVVATVVPAAAIKPAIKAVATADQGTRKPAAKPAAKPKPPGWEKAAATNATSVASAATINSRTGRYYVIAGSYTSLVNAEKGRQALLRLGHPARVILPAPGSRQFMLSAADFPDRTSADRQANILRKRMGDLWIKQY
ncbi:hypothetical protein CDA63_14945 [Hymenobacter amundsenii]|uniref:SPOR domain-containing protein n=1 Tax=Hymenobacter amundsenii TaxID=2006685 RepID=A0A246FIE5_9BACT|nr:SPOR domain-containing protein [Hymenobacter amundsenii]OWP62284.1 hypothetical protein CDA63_14945 [Hymenobacter amundsenii]